MSVSGMATASGVASRSSWESVVSPTATTVPTRIWLGRSTASSTSEIRVDFSMATVLEIALPPNVRAR